MSDELTLCRFSLDFPVSAAKVWNALLDDVVSASSVDLLRHQLETFIGSCDPCAAVTFSDLAVLKRCLLTKGADLSRGCACSVTFQIGVWCAGRNLVTRMSRTESCCAPENYASASPSVSTRSTAPVLTGCLTRRPASNAISLDTGRVTATKTLRASTITTLCDHRPIALVSI